MKRYFEQKDDSILFPRNGFFVPTKTGHVKVLFSNLYMLEANGAYTNLYLKDSMVKLSRTLSKFTAELDDRFMRIHRSYIINLENVAVIQKDGIIVMDNELHAYLSGSRKEQLFNRLNYLSF